MPDMARRKRKSKETLTQSMAAWLEFQAETERMPFNTYSLSDNLARLMADAAFAVLEATTDVLEEGTRDGVFHWEHDCPAAPPRG